MLNPILATASHTPAEAFISFLFTSFALGIMLSATILMIAGIWKLFEKAGYEGWKALIPFYNIYLLVEIAGRPNWWFLLLAIPGVNAIVWFLLCLDIAKRFGKDDLVWGGILLYLLNGVGFVLLGFNDSEYTPVKIA